MAPYSELISEVHLNLIKEISEQMGIDPLLTASLVVKESTANTWACRFEPQYSYLYVPATYAKKLFSSMETEINMQKTSWGLMQVMGGVARELGWDHWLSELCVPVIGIRFGCQHLKNKYLKYGNWRDAVSAYNAGSVRKDPVSGKYSNQAYVDEVWIRYADAIGGRA